MPKQEKCWHLCCNQHCKACGETLGVSCASLRGAVSSWFALLSLRDKRNLTVCLLAPFRSWLLHFGRVSASLFCTNDNDEFETNWEEFWTWVSVSTPTVFLRCLLGEFCTIEAQFCSEALCQNWLAWDRSTMCMLTECTKISMSIKVTRMLGLTWTYCISATHQAAISVRHLSPPCVITVENSYKNNPVQHRNCSWLPANCTGWEAITAQQASVLWNTGMESFRTHLAFLSFLADSSMMCWVLFVCLPQMAVATANLAFSSTSFFSGILTWEKHERYIAVYFLWTNRFNKQKAKITSFRSVLMYSHTQPLPFRLLPTSPCSLDITNYGDMMYCIYCTYMYSAHNIYIYIIIYLSL